MKGMRSKRVRWVMGGVAALAGVVLALPFLVDRQARGFCVDRVDAVRPTRVALVFGAGLLKNGTPSPILRDRVDAAVELYRTGKVARLLMSGDNRFPWYNEPKAMTEYAVKHGVPASAIVQDFGGRSTYDTCYRVRHIFGVRQAVLVSQEFHIARATYIARSLGIDAVGLGVSDFDRYPNLRWSMSMREFYAKVSATLDLCVIHPQPEVGGRP